MPSRRSSWHDRALFEVSFWLAAPFWLLMILAPHWRPTARLAASPDPAAARAVRRPSGTSGRCGSTARPPPPRGRAALPRG
ncbi:abscisic acid-deficient protein Aba4 family protein [Streptomyces sp. NPDC048496]|uniref:abscisic acid-deficient protein Aba4 family protein n=1 Tax=Streptomyces sp. NPDC048496 TaxID=3365558 RepID=UPI00371CA799